MTERRTRPEPTLGVASYRADPLYPRIERTVAAILQRGKVVAPVDVLVAMGLLTRERVEDWRRGGVPYLERVIHCNLTRLSRLLRILRFHAHDLNLAPSLTVYTRSGKGAKQRLRFTKTGNPKLEQAYARHFVWPGKGPFHPPADRAEDVDCLEGSDVGREAGDGAMGNEVERDGPSKGLGEAVLDIINILRGASAGMGDGPDDWERIVGIVAERDSVTDEELKLIEKAIAEAYRGWSDTQRRSIWQETESGMGDDADDDSFSAASFAAIAYALPEELLDEVTRTAWLQAEDLRRAAAKKSRRQKPRK